MPGQPIAYRADTERGEQIEVLAPARVMLRELVLIESPSRSRGRRSDEGVFDCREPFKAVGLLKLTETTSRDSHGMPPGKVAVGVEEILNPGAPGTSRTPQCSASAGAMSAGFAHM